MSIDRLTSEIVRAAQGSSGDVQVLGNAQPINVAGVQSRSVAMQSTSPFPDAKGQQQKERDWLVTVPTLPTPGESVFCFVFVAPQTEFDRFRPIFETMLQSAQF